MSALLFDAQRRACLSCGADLHHPDVGRPRRYCDADCAAEGKRESDRRHMTPERLAGMREAKARQKDGEVHSGRQLDSMGAALTPKSDLAALLTSLILPSLRKTGRCVLHGFGVFTLRTRPSRRIRNPVTHELMWLPASEEVRFRAAKRLKDAAQSPPSDSRSRIARATMLRVWESLEESHG